MVAFAGCTGAPERSTPTQPVPAASTTFATLPPVGVFTYPTDSSDVVAQISVDVNAPIPLPLLTIYGDGRVVNAFENDWLVGAVSDVALQGFFADADSIGLLDGDLVLRGRDDRGQPNIGVYLEVDGRTLNHELDLVRIERPVNLRAFLQRSATTNEFGLTDVYEPTAWINCTGDVCAVGDERGADFARPLLPHEDVDTLADEAGAARP